VLWLKRVAPLVDGSNWGDPVGDYRGRQGICPLSGRFRSKTDGRLSPKASGFETEQW
jgi:hypothetical protein